MRSGDTSEDQQVRNVRQEAAVVGAVAAVEQSGQGGPGGFPAVAGLENRTVRSQRTGLVLEDTHCVFHRGIRHLDMRPAAMTIYGTRG